MHFWRESSGRPVQILHVRVGREQACRLGERALPIGSGRGPFHSDRGDGPSTRLRKRALPLGSGRAPSPSARRGPALRGGAPLRLGETGLPFGSARGPSTRGRREGPPPWLGERALLPQVLRGSARGVGAPLWLGERDASLRLGSGRGPAILVSGRASCPLVPGDGLPSHLGESVLHQVPPRLPFAHPCLPLHPPSPLCPPVPSPLSLTVRRRLSFPFPRPCLRTALPSSSVAMRRSRRRRPWLTLRETIGGEGISMILMARQVGVSASVAMVVGWWLVPLSRTVGCVRW